VLEQQLREAGASKVEHVLSFALIPLQEEVYQAVLEVRCEC
jgi:hypothetical protein